MLLEPAQRQVAGQEPQVLGDRAWDDGRDVPQAIDDRPDGVRDRQRGRWPGPHLFQLRLVQEMGGEVRLRIEVDHEDPTAQPAHHDRQVVCQCGLADTTLVVEQRESDHGRSSR